MFIFPNLPNEINCIIEEYVVWNCLENLKKKNNIMLMELVFATLKIYEKIELFIIEYKGLSNTKMKYPYILSDARLYNRYKWFSFDFCLINQEWKYEHKKGSKWGWKIKEIERKFQNYDIMFLY